MNTYIQNVKDYITTNRKQIVISIEIGLSIVAVASLVALFIYNSTPKVIYQPTKACDLFSFSEAKELLGASTLTSSMQDPVLSGDTASSNCGYANGNPNTGKMIVAVIIVRSGINDKGVRQNKTEFAAGRPTKNIEVVKDLGDSAYFNDVLGQLNVLSGRRWIIISYGVASTPETNTVDQAVALGNKILH